MAGGFGMIAALKLLLCLCAARAAPAGPWVELRQVPSAATAPDVTAVRSLLREGADLYRDRQYRQAIGKARDALRLSPREPVALVLLAVSYYGIEEWEYFARTAVKAIHAGGAVPVGLAHHHSLSGVHPAVLTLTATELAFNPVVSARACNQPAFTVPLTRIAALAVQSTSEGEVFLNLRLRDADNPKRTRNLNFADPDSSVDRSGPLPVVRPPARAPRSLHAVRLVIEAAVQGRSLGPLPAVEERIAAVPSLPEPTAGIPQALIGTWVGGPGETTFGADGAYRSVAAGQGPVLSGVAEQVGTFRVFGSRLIIDSIRENWTPMPGSGGPPAYRGKPFPTEEYEFSIQGSRLLLRRSGSTYADELTRKR